jgi:hypothetical protein
VRGAAKTDTKLNRNSGNGKDSHNGTMDKMTPTTLARKTQNLARESFSLDTVPSNGCLLMGAMYVDFATPQISSNIHFRS